MKRWFFLRYPTYRKGDGKEKGCMRSNMEDREDVIRTVGADTFFSDKETFGAYWDIPVPVEYLYVYSVFMELYRTCNERISFQDIRAWQDVRGVRLTQYEVSLIISMNGWASEEIAELRDSED